MKIREILAIKIAKLENEAEGIGLQLQRVNSKIDCIMNHIAYRSNKINELNEVCVEIDDDVYTFDKYAKMLLKGNAIDLEHLATLTSYKSLLLKNDNIAIREQDECNYLLTMTDDKFIMDRLLSNFQVNF